MVHSGKLIIRARQARFGAQSPVPGRLPALAGVPFGPTGPDQTHLARPLRGPFCLQDADPRPSGQALPWLPLTHRMLTVSPPDTHRRLKMNLRCVSGGAMEGLRRGNGNGDRSGRSWVRYSPNLPAIPLERAKMGSPTPPSSDQFHAALPTLGHADPGNPQARLPEPLGMTPASPLGCCQPATLRFIAHKFCYRP